MFFANYMFTAWALQLNMNAYVCLGDNELDCRTS